MSSSPFRFERLKKYPKRMPHSAREWVIDNYLFCRRFQNVLETQRGYFRRKPEHNTEGAVQNDRRAINDKGSTAADFGMGS